MKKSFLAIFLFISLSLGAQTAPPQLLLRLDDNGMNHSVVMAIKQVAETGIPFSTSVMFTCPWYQEAVAVLKQFPHVSVGVHLVLNSEWKYYRWGPVLGKSAVPTLIDRDGYFLASSDKFLQSRYKLKEVKKELEAQMDRAMRSGLNIDYVDYHMLTAVSTPDLRKLVEKLARKHHLGMSRYFGENYQTMFDVPVETKELEFFKRISNLDPARVNLMVMHVAEDTPEMQALIDMNDTEMHSETKPLVSMHRSTELNILLSRQFHDLVSSGAIKLVTYRDLREQAGLEKLQAPPDL